MLRPLKSSGVYHVNKLTLEALLFTVVAPINLSVRKCASRGAGRIPLPYRLDNSIALEDANGTMLERFVFRFPWEAFHNILLTHGSFVQHWSAEGEARPCADIMGSHIDLQVNAVLVVNRRLARGLANTQRIASGPCSPSKPYACSLLCRTFSLFLRFSSSSFCKAKTSSIGADWYGSGMSSSRSRSCETAVKGGHQNYAHHDTYNLPKKQHILTAHKEDAALNVCKKVLHVDSLNRVL